MFLRNNVKIVKVDTLDVIATNVIDYFNAVCIEKRDFTGTAISENEKIAVILDAKRGKFFVAGYEVVHEREETFIKKVYPDSLMSIKEFHGCVASSGKTVRLLGDGLLYYKDRFESEGIKFFDDKYWSPSAENVFKLGWEKMKLGQFENPVNLVPFYLSRPDAKIKQR